ncbi:glycoside hydrolase family 36 protein [Curtobacterium sp. MCPF17_052]|uniref:glycoside hydrolase family 36 protein n=1 Tax=Curtobacterium sp. MCPF17_052 TaxID=2175655 RepID=UPI0024DFE110|nr:alpha-galactosidase [Curtobacterium sp. MCPF17_052]WIB12624.1 alpha-galactosidase [Curtobacterium sp. MCPF17_052]
MATREVHFDGSAVPVGDGVVATRLGWLVGAGDLRVLLGSAATDFHRGGWNSWSPTGWAPLDESPLRIWGDDERRLTADDAANDTADRHEGNGFGALGLPDGRVLLLGALGLGTPRVGGAANALWGTVESDDGDGWFLGVGPETAVFARYAELLRARLGTPTAPPVSTLWCSWYSSYEDIDEGLIADVTAGLGDLPVDVVQIDDGWEEIVGDWVPNDRFPSGMAATAAEVAARGSRPGLWLAPLICLPGSRTATDHPEWLVQDPAGGALVAGYNWDSHYFALDTTRPDVQEHLDAVVRTVVSWGFRYLKLDFLYAGALPGVRHRDVPRERAYREALERIRTAAGPDVYLLGCGAPMLPSIGVLDGVRVGPDTASDWAPPGSVADPSHEGGSERRGRFAPATLDARALPGRPRRGVLPVAGDHDVGGAATGRHRPRDRGGLPVDVRPGGVARRRGTGGPAALPHRGPGRRTDRAGPVHRRRMHRGLRSGRARGTRGPRTPHRGAALADTLRTLPGAPTGACVGPVRVSAAAAR